MKRLALRPPFSIANFARAKAFRNQSAVLGACGFIAGIVLMIFSKPTPGWLTGSLVSTGGIWCALLGFVNYESLQHEKQRIAEVSRRRSAEALSVELAKRIEELISEASDRGQDESEGCESCNEHYRLGVRDALTAFNEAREDLDTMAPKLRREILRLVKTEQGARG